MIRSIWTLAVGTVVTVWYALRVILTSVFAGEKGLCRHCDDIARNWSRGILWAAGVKVRVEGTENFREGGAQIVVSNHESWFDVFALLAELPVSTRFVAKKELEKIPLFGRAWTSCGHISVDRSDRKAAIESLNVAGQQIRDRGLTIVMFPEGTRSPDGRLQKFKKGAFVLGIQAGVPVVPVAVTGTRPIMPKGSFRIRKGEVKITVGEPIPVEGLVHADRERLAQRAHDAVAELRGGEGRTSLLPGETAEAPETETQTHSGPRPGSP